MRILNYFLINLSKFELKSVCLPQVGAHKRNVNPSFEPGLHPIDTISYGVQDLVYTRWSCGDMASIKKHVLAEFLR